MEHPASNQIIAIQQVAQKINPDISQGGQVDISPCQCGEQDCVGVCYLRKWLFKSQPDQNLWDTAVLEMAKSYFPLAEAYKRDMKFGCALNALRLALTLFIRLDEDSSLSTDFGPSPNYNVESQHDHLSFLAEAWLLLGNVYFDYGDKGTSDRSDESKPFLQYCEKCFRLNCNCNRLSSGHIASSNIEVQLRPNRRKQKSKQNSDHTTSISSIHRISYPPMAEVLDILDFLRGRAIVNRNDILNHAIRCFEEAKKNILRLPSDLSSEKNFMSFKAMTYFQLGRAKYLNQDHENAMPILLDAALAYMELNASFRVVESVLCLGRSQKALAGREATRLNDMRPSDKKFKKIVEKTKSQYCKVLRFYAAGLSKLNSDDSENSVNMKSLLLKDIGITYVALARILAKYKTHAYVYKSENLDNVLKDVNLLSDKKGSLQISAAKAFEDGLKMFDQLNEHCHEAADASIEAARFHKATCMEILDDQTLEEQTKYQVANNHADLAEELWKKFLAFYQIDSNPTIHCTILIERSALRLRLSTLPLSNTVSSSLPLSTLFFK